MVDINKQENQSLAPGSQVPAQYLNSINTVNTTVNAQTETPDYRTQNQKTQDSFVYAIPNSIIGGISEIAESMPGIDEADADSLVRFLTTDGMLQDFKEKEDAYKLTGAIATSFVPIIGMQKLMRAKSIYGKFEKVLGEKVTRTIFPSKLSAEDRIEQVRQRATVYAKKQGNTISAETTPEIASAMFRAGTSEAIDMFKIGVAVDAGIYGLLNESEFFFPEEMSGIEIMAMYGVPNLVFSGVAGLMMRRKMKNIIRDVGEIGGEARNVAGLPVTDVLSRPGERSNLVTTYLAQQAVKETELTKAGGDSVLTGNLNTQIQAYGAKTLDQYNLMAKDSIYPGITTKHTLQDAEKNTLNATGAADFTFAHDVVSFEQASIKNIREMPEKIIQGKAKAAKDILTKMGELGELTSGTKQFDKVQGELDSLRKHGLNLENSTVVRINIDGSMALASDLKESFREISTGVIKKVSAGADGGEAAFQKLHVGDLLKVEDKQTGRINYSTKVLDNKTHRQVMIEDNLQLVDPFWKSDFSKLSFKNATSVQGVMREALKNYVPGMQGVKPIVLNKDMQHIEMDAVLELATKYGNEHPMVKETVRFNTEGFATWGELEFASLNKKYTDWVKGIEQIGKETEQVFKLGRGQAKNLDDLIVELNLPSNGVNGLHPLTEVFTDLAKADVKNLSEIYPNIQVLKKDLEKTALPTGNISGKYIENPAIELRGSQLKNYAEKREPVLAVIRNTEVNPLIREELIDAVQRQRIKLIDGMNASAEKGAPLITAITQEGLRDGERLKTAQNVQSLIEGSQLRSDRATTAMFGLENQVTHKAVDSMANAWDNITKSYVSAKFAPHNENFNKLLSSNHEGDLNLFNVAIHQQGVGWRGTPSLEPVMKNNELVGYKIPLEDHATNKRMLEEIYGISPTQAEDFSFIPKPKFGDKEAYEELVISPLAAESMLAINELSQDVLTHINQLRSLSGLKSIVRKPLHMLPKNLADKEKVWLLNAETGEIHSIASGNTAVQAKAFAKEEIENAKKQNVTLFEATEKDLENYNMLKLDDFTQMVDFSTSFKQTGRAKGTSFGQTVEIGPEVLRRMQETLINQYSTVGKVSASMFLEPEMRAAEMAARTSGLNPSTLEKGRTVWDSWMRRAIGKKSGDRKQTIGKFYGAVEDVYDSVLQNAWDRKVTLLKGGQSVAQAEKAFAGLDKAVPDYNPFTDSMQFLENTMRIKAPHNMAKHAGKLNAIAGATMLRMVNLGLATVNIMTLPTLIPVVAGSLKRRQGQTLDQWKKDISAWGSPVDEGTALWNPYRATTTGTHFFFSEEGRSVLKEAGAKGHLWQKTVEQMQLFTSPSKGYTERMITKGVDWLSIATDKTEEWSRGLSYATFYKLGKDNLKMNHESSMEFAHQMANQVIGDFRPNNRPQMFQGAAGMPFGLFTTFAWNYMQRVFGYVEKGDFKSFFRQMGLQTAFFGSKSLPGFNQYVDTFTENYDGTENMVDRLQNAYGTEMTDAFLFGSVGSLTGIAAYTRTDIRLPGSNFLREYNITDMAPAASMIKRTYQGAADFASSLVSNEGFNGRQIAENVARTFPINGMRGMIEVANGQTVDGRGQIVNENVRTATGIAAKVLGMKPLREQLVVEEMARIRSTAMKRRDARKEFRMMARSGFRSGKLDMDVLIKQYLKSTGGESGNFKRVLQNEMEFALINKGYLQMLKDSAKASNQAGMLRMINILNNEDYE